MQQKNLNQVNRILKRIRCFCFSIFVVCLTLSVCVPVNAATATEQSVVDDITQQETKKQTRRRKSRGLYVSVHLKIPLIMSIKTVSDEDLATNSCRLSVDRPDGNLSM